MLSNKYYLKKFLFSFESWGYIISIYDFLKFCLGVNNIEVI
jgi:hypothetical protein